MTLGYGQVSEVSKKNNQPQIDVYVACDTAIIEQSYFSVYHVGCDKALQRQINDSIKSLSADERKAKAIGLYEANKDKLLEDKRINQQALMQGIKKLPAIVFDEQYVVYGSLNVVDALGTYSAFCTLDKGDTNQ